jgi:hypothetical protein
VTKVFYDTEFVDDGERIHLISIGMVNDAGDTYYAVNSDMPLEKIRRSPWLLNNVAPWLPRVGSFTIGSDGNPGAFNLDTRNSDVKPRWVIRNEVRDWLLGQPGKDEPELWAWYSAYDHVALAQLFGPMVALPAGIPMFTNDIRTLQVQAERVTGQVVEMPEQTMYKHHALHDAEFDKVRYQHLRDLLVNYRDTPAVSML